jgi:RNA polymerase sigma factor (TIGR02999 family)
MNSPPELPPITELLTKWSDGNKAALDELFPLVEEELRRLAHRRMSRERPGHTLQTSALVNEAYLRIAKQNNIRWENRAHFFAIAARMMRRILVDYARSKNYAKRGGGAVQVSLAAAEQTAGEPAAEIMALHEALIRLEEFDLRQAQVVELRFFGGLTIKETAEAMDISVDTVKREWSTAKAWLYREISETLDESA